jgi:pantothenate kinase
MLDELTQRAANLAASGRAILRITGCPGCGKSTLAERLVARLDPEERWVVRVPMDGLHLANAALDRLGRRQRKGAIDTFDAFGYLALLRRIRTEQGNPVYAPDFERVLEQPIAASIAIDPDVRLVVTEGNYLLSATAPWPWIPRADGGGLVRRARQHHPQEPARGEARGVREERGRCPSLGGRGRRAERPADRVDAAPGQPARRHG